MSEDVHALCKARWPGPCIRLVAADFKTVTETFDCVVWCALLNRRIEAEDEGGMDGGDS